MHAAGSRTFASLMTENFAVSTSSPRHVLFTAIRGEERTVCTHEEDGEDSTVQLGVESNSNSPLKAGFWLRPSSGSSHPAVTSSCFAGTYVVAFGCLHKDVGPLVHPGTFDMPACIDQESR